MVNYVKTKQIVIDIGNEKEEKIDIVEALPSGGISQEDVYETWYVYECPNCGRRVKEAYRCEVLLDRR